MLSVRDGVLDGGKGIVLLRMQLFGGVLGQFEEGHIRVGIERLFLMVVDDFLSDKGFFEGTDAL